MSLPNKVKLKDSDWSALFPYRAYVLGSTTLSIAPLSLQGLGLILSKVTQITEKLAAQNFNFKSLESDPSTMIQLVALIISDAPEILSELSGLDVDDITRLPIEKAVDLFGVCLEVNLASKEGLIKNFKGLGEKVGLLTQNPLQ